MHEAENTSKVLLLHAKIKDDFKKDNIFLIFFTFSSIFPCSIQSTPSYKGDKVVGLLGQRRGCSLGFPATPQQYYKKALVRIQLK